MATIDKLSMDIYIQYARRTQYVEQINRQFNLQEAASIPPQTSVTDLYPKLSEIDLLLGVVNSYTPWAFFYPPQNFSLRRRSPFSFSKVGPSLFKEDEEELLAELEAVSVSTPEEKKEKSILKECIKQLKSINDMLGFIIGRVGQLLQG